MVRDNRKQYCIFGHSNAGFETEVCENGRKRFITNYRFVAPKAILYRDCEGRHFAASQMTGVTSQTSLPNKPLRTTQGISSIAPGRTSGQFYITIHLNFAVIFFSTALCI